MGSCSALHSKMIQFCSTEKYCDVKIRVQDKSFPCHRVVLASASEYFDALFGGSFMEKDARETVLHNIDVETFRDILSYVYTAEMCEITASNVPNLFSASLFLRIHSLEEACTEYIIRNVSSIQNYAGILALAHALNITALTNVITDHVIQNFGLFCNDETSLGITFDALSFLLDRWSESKPPFKYEDLILHFFIRWVHHASEERREDFIKLITAVDFEMISPNYVTFVMQYYKDFIDQPGLGGMPQSKLPRVMEESESTSHLPVANWHDDTEDSKKRLGLEKQLSEYFAGDEKLSAICVEEVPVPFHNPTIYKDVLGLHVYVEYFSTELGSPRRLEGVKVLSSNKYYPWFVSCETDAWRSCTERRIVVRESADLLYSMEVSQDEPQQKFCTYSSIDCTLASSVLTSPPVLLKSTYFFNMYATSRNDIYLLMTFKMKFESFENDQFSVEEINRGFYRYNCEVDKWFPAPKMKTFQNFPSICVDHNLIYLIGEAGIFQAFDYRTGKWMTLPRCISDDHNGLASGSCVLQDKVFVSRGLTSIESYDTIAGKWESIYGPKEYGMCRKMVPYDNKLWLLCRSSCDSQVHYSFGTYSPNTQEWYLDEGFNNVITRNQPNRSDGNFTYECDIKDMIRFKTCS